MKNIKQLFVCLLAISMTISVSAHAIATDAMESAISPIVITATEFDAISAQTEHVGRLCFRTRILKALTETVAENS